jgi:superfamily II DNA or RNA helicase
MLFNNQVLIDIYATYFTITADRNGYITSDVNIRLFLESLRETEYIKYLRKTIVKDRYYAYDMDTGRYHIPLHAYKNLDTYLKEYDVEYTVTEHKPRVPKNHTSIVMNPVWKDRPEHEAALAFLTDTSRTMRINNMQWGKGKTYCGIKVCSIFNYCALVVCDGVQNQWKMNVLEKTLCQDDEVYIVQGVQSLVKLFNKNKKSGYKPKFIIFSIGTLRNYILKTTSPYTELPGYQEFLEIFDIGTKIVDEVHLNFHAVVMMDLWSNLPHNLYLSATPKRSSGKNRTIFNTIFPESIIGGRNEFDKYIYGRMYKYYIPINKQDRFNSDKGYNHTKYEQFILGNGHLKQDYVKIIMSLIRSEYYEKRHENGKLLIFVSTIVMATTLRDYISYNFKDLDVRTYTSDDPISNLYEADVIIGTPKSCGTAKDIRNLQTAINTVSLGSEPQVEQMLGRLRKLDGFVVRFIDIYNNNMYKHKYHAKIRRTIYKAYCIEFFETNL